MLNPALIGLGSVLMGDDGLGPYFVRSFESRWELPPELTVADLGTPGPELVSHLSGHDALLVVDAVRAAGEPGEIRVFRNAEIRASGLGGQRGAHDPNLEEALSALRLIVSVPDEIVLVGAIPARVELHPGLSMTVRQAIPSLEKTVVQELRCWGLDIRPRQVEGSPDLWWLEQGAA